MKLMGTELDGDLKRQYFANEQGDLTISLTQDIQPVFERNKLIRDNGDGWNDDKTFKHVASIPVVVIEMWKKQGININNKNDLPKIMAMLNSSEYVHLRSGSGNI